MSMVAHVYIWPQSPTTFLLRRSNSDCSLLLGCFRLETVRFRIYHRIFIMDLAKKRKVDSECRAFNGERMSKYFFTEFSKKAVCLLCSESVAVLKEYNISRHYATKHAAHGSTLSAAERQTKATELERKLIKQRNVFRKAKLNQKAATHFSFVVAYNIAKHSKSSGDGEFIKK